MQIDVLLFGPQAQAADSDRITVHLPQPVTASQVLAALGDTVPALEPSLRFSRLAVNHRYSEPDECLAPGDEVALIGMVSGG